MNVPFREGSRTTSSLKITLESDGVNEYLGT